MIQLWATKNKNDEWWSSFITAPMAILFNYLIIDIKTITPNKITLLSFIIAIVSVIFIVIGGTISFIFAAILIHLSHVLDCMDGQMARYRKTSSRAGAFFDRITDQIQVSLWFAALGYAAYTQSQHILPVFLAFIGVAFYNLRGYAKYVSLYMDDLSKQPTDLKHKPIAGLEFGLLANLKWFIKEQWKIISFDEGVFIFMLSLALIFNQLTPVLWVFAISQLYYGLVRSWQRGWQIANNQSMEIKK